MAQIIDFDEARRKRNKPALDELHALYEDLVSVDIDAAFRYHCGLDGSEEDARKLDTLFQALHTNSSLSNIDKALGIRKTANP